jgi:serine/threonine protein phosphatase PrpC
MSLSVQVAGRTDVGCVRSNNEDNFGYDTACGVYVVCDGMGGQAAGEVASKLAVETVLEYFRRYSPEGNFPQVGEKFDDISQEANALASAVQAAGIRIFHEALEHPGRQGMGSTIVALLVRKGKASIAHVGDSRVYLLRDAQIRLLTADHSLVMEQVRRGLMTVEEAERSSIQNIITRALGPEDCAEPDVQDVEISPGDIFLLATDGLTKLVKEQQLREITTAAPSLEKTCDALVAAARAAGGDDNITCLLVRIGG